MVAQEEPFSFKIFETQCFKGKKEFTVAYSA